MRIRTLSRCPGNPSEWQWTEAVTDDSPEGATVEEYVEVHNDSTIATHLGVVVVGTKAADELAVEDIRGQIHNHIGTLVAWVPRVGEVAYELVEE